ncbi:acetate--CoA ligase family protein [Mesorhizobium sp. VK25A]|uniref:Acetate--CoA ligase family protein n=1 Tax=Mesorhizobium vachelliae TaxID=3072309 RepID=A0ABU5A5W3_9HYPH|nr:MULTISPECIES: acetate--CoA ligase family protein [unclassified Mesorhizobium]MDX8533091.1 acetate--CoA ligase family protein [Mesorhizobium sp. VK25D]MDX8545010.1 acetate--CoA ligase family protein [Mesorhizobium sp. VK25A]
MQTSATSPTAPRISPALRRNFQRLLAPATMAFIGGTQAERTLTTLRAQDFHGEVYAVHPKRKEIAGYTCVPRIQDLPIQPDAVFLAVNAEASITALDDLRKMDAGGAVCYASGFSEIGEAGADRNRRFIEAAGDMAVVGPNCYGLVNYVNHGSIWPGLYPKLKQKRGAAVVSQSGNVTGHFVSNDRSVPFSYLISAGNQAVLGFEDYIDFLVDDPNVTCLGLFMEGIRNVASFSQACLRAQAKSLPVIVCRSGRSELGAAMAASHTSSLAGQNEYYDALFDRLGVIRTDTVPQFLEMLKLASLAEPLAGPRITVYSSSGGDNGLAADYCSFAGLQLPQPSAAQIGVIKPMLPQFGHVSNPLDFTAGYWGNEALLTPMFTTMLSGECDAGMLVIDYPPEGSPRETSAQEAMDRALAAAGKATGKPVFHASVNTGGITSAASEEMIAQGIVPLQGLHDAAEVISKWAGHCARVRGDATADPGSLVAKVPYPAKPLSGAARTVNEAESKRRLAARGLPIPQGSVLSLTEIADLPDRFKEPMVLKVLHDDLPHKTEVGGVALKLGGRDEALNAARQIVANVARHAPSVRLEKFLLEPMQAPPLAELIVGVKRDPLFGMVLVIGAGGILVELLKDATPLLLPVSRADVEAALRGLKCFALLNGFRGRPAANLEPVIDAIMSIAAYAGDNLDTLSELDVNPLMVSENGAIAVDALIVEVPGESNASASSGPQARQFVDATS